jgi:hypothetical protein
MGVHRHVEDGAPRLIGNEPQPAIMRLNDRAADGKAHAHAFGFGRKQRVEEPI